MIKAYSFDACLLMSQGYSVGGNISDVLLHNIVGATGVRPASKHDDRHHGIDWWVDRVSGRSLGVDIKVRTSDPMADGYEDDLALEWWSVMERQGSELRGVKVGWTRDQKKRTDLVMWFFQPTGRWCWFPFHDLCAAFIKHGEAWRSHYPVRLQQTDGRGVSECVFVPTTVIRAAITDCTMGVHPVIKGAGVKEVSWEEKLSTW